jgi:peptidoglycan-N-acetylglucosamine deacetylase
MNVQFPRIFRILLGKNLLWHKKTSSKVIYLTFDDGPVPEVTPQILDILDNFQWKATFFCVGENVKRYPELYCEILRRGHKTGNHTFNHLKGFSVNTGIYKDNIREASKYIQSNLLRPPHGQITFKQVKALKNQFQIVMWDVITHDYNRKLSAEQVFENARKHTRKGSIVVFHDSIKAKRNVLEALPKTLNYWNNEGFESALL